MESTKRNIMYIIQVCVCVNYCSENPLQLLGCAYECMHICVRA